MSTLVLCRSSLHPTVSICCRFEEIALKYKASHISIIYDATSDAAYTGEGSNLRSKNVEPERPTGLELYPYCYEWNNTANYEGGYEMPHTPFDPKDPTAEPETDSNTALKPSIISIVNSKKELWELNEGPNEAVTFYDSRVIDLFGRSC